MDMLTALEGITADTLLSIPEDERPAYVQSILDYLNYRKFNRIEYASPYQYQKDFMNAGSRFKRRFLRAGNRVGKTWCGALEMAYHLTGLYPEDWQGLRIERSGRLFWCVGVNLTMVADIQQKELLGTSNATLTELIGTGTIPRDCIELTKGFEKDGARVVKCRIKHVDGGLNELAFFGSTDPNALMGREVAGVWMDEESPYSFSIYSQCAARVVNSLGVGNNGFIFITATPEEGDTQLNQKFSKDESGVFYLQQVTWWDVPERFTVDAINELLAALPDWERDMRSKGLPAVGKGAVFKISDDEITVIDEIKPLPHWKVLAAVDWGHVVDPTVIVIALYDPDHDAYYIYREFYLDNDEEERSPRGVARVLLDSPFRGVPVIVPHDSGLASDASESNGKMLARFGVNVHAEPFRNPTQTQLKFKQNAANKSVRSIETGLREMDYLFKENRLKVDPACVEWLKEKHAYSYKFNDRTHTLGYAGADHVIDASRYAVMSLMGGLGCDWSEVSNTENTQLKVFQTATLNF